MANSLTIFIDALPFEQLQKMPYTREFASQARLIPILGYSVNCQTQLFTGKTPDEIGFWCEWQYDPDNSPFRRWRWALSFASLVEGLYPARRLIHKILDRLRLVSCTKNIPLRKLADFNEQVSAGQVIARIDPANFQARLTQSRADLASARAGLEYRWGDSSDWILLGLQILL